MKTTPHLCLVAFSALLASNVGAEEPMRPSVRPAATPAPATSTRKPDFDLQGAGLKKLLQRQTTSPDADPRIVEFWLSAWSAPASATRKKIETPPVATRARPALIECESAGENCVAYDAEGRYLRAVPRRAAAASLENLNYSVEANGCLGSNDMMSIFERQDRCLGITRVTPSFWEPGALRFAPRNTAD